MIARALAQHAQALRLFAIRKTYEFALTTDFKLKQPESHRMIGLRLGGTDDDIANALEKLESEGTITEAKEEHSRIEKKAKEKHDSGLLEAWEDNHAEEFDVIDTQIKETFSRDLLDQARELYLPTPSFNDKTKWVSENEFSHTGPWSILTPEAMIELNGAIRKERQARREILEWWIKVIGGFVTILTGLVGAGIGLVAVWKK